MLLKEFFSRPIEIDQNKKQDPKFENDLLWFILDHDRLHKDYFFPIAKKLKNTNECGEGTIYELFMPMVVRGCKEYFADRKMEGRMSKKFPLEMRESLCRRLYDHYTEDVKKGKYRLG
jgi:hypothetical protein